MNDKRVNDVVNLLVLDGDGIGSEIMAATLAVLRAADAKFGLRLVFEVAAVGLAALRAEGTTLPQAVIDRAKAADGVVLGPVSHHEYPPLAQGGLNPSGELRKILDLYANIRPARSREGFPPRCGKPVDLVIVRENTEGFYADRNMYLGSGEFMPTADLALAVRKITRQASTRIAETAFKLAMLRRKHVTAVHKANVLRVSDGLYLESVRAVADALPAGAIRRAHYRRHGGASGARRQPIRRRRHHQHVSATFSPTRRARFPAASALPPRSTPAMSMAWRRRSTARRPTSPARTSPIRPR